MSEPPPLLTVLGQGLLANAVRTRLLGPEPPEPAPTERQARPVPARSGPVVVVSDSWLEDPLGRARYGGSGDDAPVLPVSAELGHVVIGPLTFPEEPGCWTCAESRRERNREDREEFNAVFTRHRKALTTRPSSWLTTFACDTVATLVEADLRAAAAGEGPRTRSALVFVSLADLSVRTHRFLPDPLCPECGVLPDDTAECAEVTLTPRPKPHAGAFRLRAAEREHEAVTAAFVDSETGLVPRVRTADEGGLPVAVAPLAIRGTTATESGWGRSHDYRSSEATAVLEAVERWGGLQPGGKRTTVRAAYRDLRGSAIDPRSLGLHTGHQNGFPFTPFHDGLELRWVWAHSFGRGRPVLVPETYAYYGAHLMHTDEPMPVYEVSNGCALGANWEEAVLHGLLEVAERDAFLLAWYARRPLPRIASDSARDRRVPLLRAHLEEETDREITLLETTVEQRIPCVWALARNRHGDPGRAAVVCAGGAHLDPERAVLNALRELGPILSSLDRALGSRREHVSRLAADPDEVRTMGDHSLLYADPSVSGRLDFLRTSTRERSLPEMREASVKVSPADLTDDLRAAVQRYLDTGLDVLVVDQTTSEHRAADLSCVKVIVPGTLPMTFGHRRRRVHGLPRLYSIPRLLGDPDPPSTEADLNPYPHPFP
ncbi:TOMM precursor leader peptide-binding protein [Nocardiopsis xinjiangensis]|uniref:TOMM precursor leader peptide-binding protein n=1 Tax=Nocardiopsis xinjiangensis TaxID=124285 RepID=UPI00034B4E3F|nr:TOMM precursor leader peptide-binding protein [Nocardiopsis xinjiangensis]